jgi:microcin C transport system permease protein
MSPLNRRRLANFRANRRGWWSFWIFLVLFVLCLFAEFLANDQPFLVRHDGRFFVPVLVGYAEEDIDPSGLQIAVNWHDTGFTRTITDNGGWILWPLIPYSYDTLVTGLDRPSPSPPSARNLLGTDGNVRDVLARVIYGFRISVLFGFTLVIVTSIIGIVAGAVQGYYGGATDLIFQRVIEIWNGMPELYLLIILASIITPSFWILLLFLLLFSWTGLTGVVRAEFLRGRNLDYVRAARALGVSDRKVMFRHILPNAMVATLTLMPFLLSSSVTVLASLDFLGFGLPVGSPSLGELVNQARQNLSAWWLAATSFVVLGGTLLLLVFVGEAVRDAFDPRKLPGGGR